MTYKMSAGIFSLSGAGFHPTQPVGGLLVYGCHPLASTEIEVGLLFWLGFADCLSSMNPVENQRHSEKLRRTDWLWSKVALLQNLDDDLRWVVLRPGAIICIITRHTEKLITFIMFLFDFFLLDYYTVWKRILRQNVSMAFWPYVMTCVRWYHSSSFVRHKMRQPYISRTGWPTINKFYIDIRTDLIYIHTEYDV